MAQQLKHLMGLGFGAMTSKAINGTIADNLTATGSSQADALQLTEDINVAAVVTANSGIKLPPIPQPGDEIFVGNLGQNAVNIYPSSGGSIQGATTDAPYSLNAGCCATFTARVGSKNWVVFSNGGSISGVVGPTLGTLALSATTFTVGTSASGTITGATALSTITASGLPTGLTINGSARTWAYDGTGSATTGTITLTETLAGATNTPHNSSIGYTVNAAAVTLGTLTFSSSTFTVGTSTSGTIIGATATSTITASGLPTGVTINGAARTWAYDGTGTATTGTITLTETLAGATNTPHNSTVSYTVSSGTSLSTPTVTNVSTAGTTPLVLALSDADYVAGKYLQWEFAGSLSPAKNGDGSYTTTSQSGIAFIDGDSWARLDIALGYNTPGGAFAFHCRVLQENASGLITVTDSLGDTFTADASSWSTDYTDTINVTTTTFDPSNKNSNLTFSNGNLTLLGGVGVGAADQLTRTTNQVPSSGKYYAEFHVDAIASGSPVFGCTNNVFTYTSTGTGPGFADSNGAVYERNGDIYPGGSAGPSFTTGDTGMLCIKFTGTVATIWVGKNGTWVGNPSAETGGTSQSITTCYGIFGVSDQAQLTANFGQSAFTYTKPTGSTAWQ